MTYRTRNSGQQVRYHTRNSYSILPDIDCKGSVINHS